MASNQEITLGKLITHDDATRDAVHIAIVPAIAAHELVPGESIGFWRPGDAPEDIEVGSVEGGLPLGIVDPFLSEPINKGDRFWVFLLPNTITSLRHVWRHPFLDGPATDEVLKRYAVDWITDFSSRLGLSYDRLIEVAETYIRTGECEQMNSERYKDYWNDFPRFWMYYRILRGPLSENLSSEDVPFTCSC